MRLGPEFDASLRRDPTHVARYTSETLRIPKTGIRAEGNNANLSPSTIVLSKNKGTTTVTLQKLII